MFRFNVHLCWWYTFISVCGIVGAMSWNFFCGIIIFSINLILFPSHCNGGKILVFPVDGSHWINMKILLEELHSRGHNISLIRASTSWYIPEKSPLYTSITIEMDQRLENAFNLYLQEHMRVCIYEYSGCKRLSSWNAMLLLQKTKSWSIILEFYSFNVRSVLCNLIEKERLKLRNIPKASCNTCISLISILYLYI